MKDAYFLEVVQRKRELELETIPQLERRLEAMKQSNVTDTLLIVLLVLSGMLIVFGIYLYAHL